MIVQPVLVPNRHFPNAARAALVAVVIAAVIAVGIAVTRPDAPGPVGTPLPDPVVMRSASTGTPAIATTVGFWAQRVAADRIDLPSRRFYARSLMAQAAESGDLTGYEAAEEQFRTAVAQSPRDAQSLLGLAGALAAQHEFATTASLARQVLDRDPASIPARVSLGDAQFELGQYRAARATYDGLAAMLPGSGTVASRAARVAQLDGDATRAVDAARRALIAVGDLDQRPADAAFYWFQLANYELQAGRIVDAGKHLEAGLRIAPRHLPSLELLARVRVEQGRLPEARRRYRSLVTTTPAADLHGELAKVERALGHTAAAREQVALGLRVGHEQLGRFPAERRHLASFFADTEPATALAAARTDFAARQDIHSAGILAWAEYRTGHLAAAVRHSRAALRFGTADPVLRAQGGLIEARAGHDTRARRLLTAALRDRPNYDLEWAPRARAALDRLED